MKKIFNVIIIISFITASIAPFSSADEAPVVIGHIGPVMEVTNETVATSLTLSDCYALALKQSETIAIDANFIKEAEARFLQALSIMMPYLSYQSVHTQEAVPDDKGSTFGSLKPTKSTQNQFQVNQVLFSGFKAFAAMGASTFEKKQLSEEKLRAEQLLLVDVANAFYLVIEEREDLKALIRTKTALNNRVKELKARENLGRSRASEVVNAKAQLYTVEADIKVVKSQEIVARQLLEFLIGAPVNKVADSYEIPPYLMPEEYYVSKFVNRPDLKALGYASKFSKKQLDVVNSDFLPTVSWQGNFYTQRTGFDKGTDWDVMLNVEVPIFNGTETIGKSREYRLKWQDSELRYMRLKRFAAYDIKDSYVKFTTALAVHENLRKAYYTAKVNYYLQRKDYERSLVNNLDVLASIQTLQDAQRNYIHAIYEAKRLYWQLRVSVGESITEALNDTV